MSNGKERLRPEMPGGSKSENTREGNRKLMQSNEDGKLKKDGWMLRLSEGVMRPIAVSKHLSSIKLSVRLNTRAARL
jgi:hypothetical protein